MNLVVSFEAFQPFLEECKVLQTILETKGPFDLESLSTLCDYLQQKRDNLALEAKQSPKVQQLKATRFKGHKQLVDAFLEPSVQKLCILTFSTKNGNGKFSYSWINEDN